MNSSRNPIVSLGIMLAIFGLGFGAAYSYLKVPAQVTAPVAAKSAERRETAPAPKDPPAPASAATPAVAPPPAVAPVPKAEAAPAPVAAPTPATNAVAAVAAPPVNAVPPVAVAAPPAAPGLASTNAPADSEDIQLSFQGANVDMIVQWLAKTTGKSVVKHKGVQCQISIVSSKKLPVRDAVNLVYRALSLEGFTTVESGKSILILPEGQEPKMSLELVDASHPEIPEGRRKIIKMFPVKNMAPAELRDKVKNVLSDKGTIELADRSSQLIVTDYTDNLRLLSDLIKELDVPSGADAVVEFFSLKHSEAEEIGNLMTVILNAQAGALGSSASSKPPSPPRGGGAMIMGPNGPVSMGPGGPEPQGGGGGAPAAASGGSGQQIRIWPDKASNRLIVTSPKARLAEVRQLLDLLDTDKPEDVTIRVLPLKNVNAEDLVKEIGPLYQKKSGKALKDNIEITANTRSNSLIILSSEANFKAFQKLIQDLDTDDAQEKAMKVFPLKNADAEDVAKQLQDLNQDQDRQSGYPFFIFGGSSSGGGKSKKINVVADKRRNSVMVQGPPATLESIEKMVKTLDEPITDNTLAPKIFRMKFVSASDIEDVLNELFLKKQQTRNYWDPYSFNPFGDSRDNASTGGRLYGKVRITSEPYSNSIIVTSNSPENLAAVEEVLKELDVPSQAGETTLRVPLKFAKATTVASSINVLFAKAGSPLLRPQGQPNQPANPQQNPGVPPASASQNGFSLETEAKEDGYFPWLGGNQENFGGFRGGGSDSKTTRPVSDLVGRVRIVPDRRINSLLVTCNVHFFPQVLKLIDELDAPTAQVLIEAKIIEVSSDFRDKLGTRFSPDGSRTFDASDYDNSVMLNTDAAYHKVFAGSATPAVADSMRKGVLDTKVNLDLLIQFLRKNTDAKVLAQPQINIADNELGKLFVGAQVPIITGTFVGGAATGQSANYTYKDVGIILEVTPHINDNAEVALRIRAESSSIRPGETVLNAPVLDTRNFRTDLLLKTGETVVLGGIIQREQNETLRKTPFLGDIPGLGWAFKKKDKVTRDVELMVFLRCWVVRTPEQAKLLMEDVEKKTPMIKEWDKENEKGLDEKKDGKASGRGRVPPGNGK